MYTIYTFVSNTKFIEFLGREYLQYSLIEEVYLVLDEGGTEIDEEEYFQVKRLTVNYDLIKN